MRRRLSARARLICICLRWGVDPMLALGDMPVLEFARLIDAARARRLS